MQIIKDKSEERKRFRKVRKQISSIDQENINRNLELFIELFHKTTTNNKYIAIYWPLRNEIDIRGLKKNYQLALPKCNLKKELEFFAWDDSPLKKDSEGIPSPDNEKLLSFNDISLILMPCLAIDRSLTRLGHGGGYYDKLRSHISWKAITSIGILTSNCISNDLLAKAEWDIALDGFITEKEIYV